MKTLSRRMLALLLTLCLLFSLALTAFADYGTLPVTDVEVGLVAVDKLDKNDETRHITATALSNQAIAYYTGDYTYAKLSQLPGASSTENSGVAAQNNQLYNALYELMSSTQKFITTYTGYSGNALATYWAKTDSVKDETTYIYFYSDFSADTGTMNREHIWPKSRASFYQKNGGADLHHLRPSYQPLNAAKSNRMFGNIVGVYPESEIGTGTGILKDVYWRTGGGENGVFECKDEVKGDVARILLYVYVRWQQPNLYSTVDASLLPTMESDDSQYDNLPVIESLDTLLQWCREDPVDTWEMKRNDLVQLVEGNRNVFIDYPELAWQLFGLTAPTCMATPTNTDPQHSFALTSEEPASCTEGGVKVYTCQFCGETEEELTKPLGHDYRDTVIAPTCEEQGYTLYVCTRCGDELREDFTDALGHDWGAPTYTWAANNSTVTAARTCTRDNTHVESEKVNTAYTEPTPPSCTETGVGKYTATFQNAAFQTQTKTVTAAALGHDYVTTTVPATTEHGGYDEHVCSRCGDTYRDNETPKLDPADPCTDGHDWGEPTYTWAEDNSTCTATQVCRNDPTHVETEKVKTSAVTVEPTCTEAGHIDYTARFQGDAFQTQTKTEPLAALGHDFVDGTCVRCGAEDPDYTGPVDPCEKFTDVDRTAWYHGAVDYALENGLMNGTSGTTFDPTGTMTRTMLVQVLYNLEGTPDVSSIGAFAPTFTDVKGNEWFAKAVTWASYYGIVSGYDSGAFGVNDPVTREQIASL